MTKSAIIRYNLRDRGRKFTGKDRSFNIKAICDAVNSPECQERVAARDMQGYLGHWPRVRFGMDSTEGGIAEGKAHAVEAAIVTTRLKAFDDGTIEHETEFLDTVSGQIAAKMFDNKVGGFSSAIDTGKPKFFAFDYVANPNYLGNSFRGIALDDAFGDSGTGELTYDDVMQAEAEEQASGMIFLLDSINSERNASNAVIDRLTEENEQLLSMLARTGLTPSQALDSASIMPIAVSIKSADRMARDAQMFRSAELPRFIEPKGKEAEADPLYDRLLTKYSR